MLGLKLNHVSKRGPWMCIVPCNGLLPVRSQAITWTNADWLSIGPSWTNFSEILIEILAFSIRKMCLKMSSAKWGPFISGGDEISFLVLRPEHSDRTKPVSMLQTPWLLALPGHQQLMILTMLSEWEQTSVNKNNNFFFEIVILKWQPYCSGLKALIVTTEYFLLLSLYCVAWERENKTTPKNHTWTSFGRNTCIMMTLCLYREGQSLKAVPA